MPQERLGVVYGALAYFVWGLLPLYWRLLEPASALEILAHRFLWSLVVVLAILAVMRHWRWTRDLRHRPKAMLAVSLAAVVIAGNWAVYIWAVNDGHVVEASLGYFINPIVTVCLGVLVLRERLRPGQWVAVGTAAAAVVVLTVDYGRLPWIALVLGLTFAAYGLIKKLAGVPAIEGLAVETAVLVVPAFAYVLVLESNGEAVFGHEGLGHAALLACAGLATALPLLSFGAAARRIPLSLLGLLQYIAPSLQFLLGVVVFSEPMPPVRLVGFALVWCALVMFTTESLTVRRRRVRQLAMQPAG
ncbi:MAG: EamA family transporter RarD [Actinomycetes bacterium]